MDAYCVHVLQVVMMGDAQRGDLKTFIHFTVADPRRRPPMAHNFLDFMQFLEKNDKILSCHPLLEGPRPFLQDILLI